MDDVRVVELKAEDLPIFKKIRLESLKMAPSAFANTFADWSSLSDEEWQSRMKCHVFVTLKGQEPVGIMGLLPQLGEKRSHRATIIMVYMRESERGSGLARHLLQVVTDFARQIGVRQLELNVNHSNARAIRFYERHGFETVGRIPAATIEDGHKVDELIMVHQLDEKSPG
ncbi:GNAT family N-acetyltransferase [Paracoccus kondratievae]|uniref:N-acetyltransferase n=1 Tax=Paracoccus kondratievae TaxID=135740 RepID=A0AAD3NVN5_9RHOB|nr:MULTISPECIES: GNAT family N-acetyltransferase [Paracoccus]QFQ86815.1 GNAT family N-acetyltransferase [Paracoccus kondratievae]GLK63596.1 N-acetyltransferase [Paracoccus kondratievae]